MSNLKKGPYEKCTAVQQCAWSIPEMETSFNPNVIVR